MLRIPSRLGPRVSSQVSHGVAPRRLRSSQPRSSGHQGKILIVTAGATSVVAGGVAFAAWSPDNRKVIESTIPGSSYLLGPLLGPIIELSPPQHVSTKITQDFGLVKKKQEQEIEKKRKAEEDLEKIRELESAELAESTGSIVEFSENNETLSKEDFAKNAPDIIEEPVSELQKTESIPSEEIESSSLLQEIDNLVTESQKNVTLALSMAEDATIAIRRHAEKAYQAIDAGQDKELLFAAVAELSKIRSDMIKMAEEKISLAEQTIQKLLAKVEAGITSKLATDSKVITSYVETSTELQYAVSKIKEMVADAERDWKIVDDYRDMVEKGRETFEAEVRSLLPEVKLGQVNANLTPDELNLLIAHAHRRVLQLQKQVARQQTLEHERFKEALYRQRDDDSNLLHSKIKVELSKQNQSLELEYRRKIDKIKEDVETELLGQLKRQAAAHRDHLADVLSQQEKDLETKWSDLLHDKLQMEKDKYFQAIAGMVGQLEGLKSAMVARADVDKAAYAARELWLACESLKSALRLGNQESKSWEDQLKPLSEHVTAIKVAAGKSDPYVETVLTAVSSEAQIRGVYTEDALRERFIKVERICKRVSMINDNGGSLMRYLLSYVQSFLILNAFEYMPGRETRDEEVEVDSLSIYEILARARYCLDKDDLTQAVRYMNLLRGEPRNVAGSWLKEARLTLETRQAASALLSYAAATAVKAL